MAVRRVYILFLPLSWHIHRIPRFQYCFSGILNPQYKWKTKVSTKYSIKVLIMLLQQVRRQKRAQTRAGAHGARTSKGHMQPRVGGDEQLVAPSGRVGQPICSHVCIERQMTWSQVQAGDIGVAWIANIPWRGFSSTPFKE
jgi:hypothetical protein